MSASNSRHRRVPRLGTVVLAVVASACLGLPAAAQPMTATATPSPSAQVITLITGEHVTVSGHPDSLGVVPLAGETGMIQTFRDAGGDRYVVPAVAVPYAGRQLDLSLFDVSALVRDGLTGTTQVPVSLTFDPGVTPTAPPGIAITSVSGSTAQGVMTTGADFNAALRKQIGADIAAGHPAGTAPLFGGLAQLRLAAPAAPIIARPQFPLNILQINANDPGGAPINALVLLINTDSVAKEGVRVPVVGGIGRVAVPSGNYFAFAPVTDFDSAGNVIANRLVVVNDFTVAPAPATNTVTIDERTADQQITATTPKPANKDGAIIHVLRTDATGVTIPLTVIDPNGPTPPVFVSPTAAPKVGTMHYVLQWDGESPAGTANPYRYDVAFTSDRGIPANENFVVRDSQLATARVRFSTDPANVGNDLLLAGAMDDRLEAAEGIESLSFPPIPAPGTITEFLGTAAGGQWAQSLFGPFFGSLVFADTLTFRAGHDYPIDWEHGPRAPGFGQFVGPEHGCLACTTDSATDGTVLSLGFNPRSDSVPTHLGFALALVRSHLKVTRDGTTVSDAPGRGVDITNIPATPSTYQATLDMDLSGNPGITQSTASHTELTFKTPALGAGNTMPAEVLSGCDGQVAGGKCQILPVISLSYGLATDETNTSHAAVQVMRLNVGHLTYDGFGSHARINSVSVAVSFDGGTTWVPANVFGTNGNYVAVWRNPTTPVMPMLKVAAADVDGNAITQTVTNAYTFAGGAS